MTSENQGIVRCKQPIKIEKPTQCLLPFYSVGERIFFFSVSAKVIIIVIHKYI